MRLLLSWVQIHPAIGHPDTPGRIQCGAHQAVDAEDFDAGRRYEPDTDLDRKTVDAAMAASPPRSMAEFIEMIAGEVSTVTGFHVTPQKIRPLPEPEEEDVEPETPSA